MPRRSHRQLEFLQPAWGRFDHSAGAEQGLGDDRRHTAVGLRVQQFKTGVQARVVTRRPLLAESAAVTVGSQDRVVARCEWSVSAVPPRERHGARGVAHSVEAHHRAGNLVAARVAFGDSHGCFVRIAARGEEHAAVESRRSDFRQPAGEDNLPVVEHGHVAMDQRLGTFLEGLHDARVVVAQTRRTSGRS